TSPISFRSPICCQPSGDCRPCLSPIRCGLPSEFPFGCSSQHIADWYTFSHIIHGFIFYWVLWLLFRKWTVGERALGAIFIEAAWEVAENSPWIIDRYREATIAVGYTGDSVLNSVFDILWMLLGFFFAWRMPVWVTILTAIVFELLALWVIRDDLTLNVLMLLYPVEAIKVWQAG
ncbi:MAG: DUF2585 domain-containing protein, partial [Roseibium sp.]|nr:DUF2585 domain-containing protein [Roseibium sp.]